MADVSTIKPITRLLIANRGEIARRIIRTAHEMGISTVAIYADGDAEAPFVHEADSAIALNGRTSAETYLDAEKVLAACRRSGADAVHPGYGFLSENTKFADAVTSAGIVWVGPSSTAIAQMGDKLSAKRLMQEADVPTLPARELTRDEDASAAAEEIGYPVLVKASAGGGGRGMRVVESAAELEAAIEGARRESKAAFGDDTMFLERWLTSSRHVEIQILGDNHGNLVHLFERECSIQRRHQKVLEEAPANGMAPSQRAAMGEAAVVAARAVEYEGAGTVEFLVDAHGSFYFLEMNTRVQVEHPVTEMVTGVDIVQSQLRIAAGERLDFSQDDLAIRGHAIEARVYAEDPDKQFFPSPGDIQVYSEPSGEGIRVDSGVREGSTVTVYYDPLLAKLIAWGEDRSSAISRLAKALDAFAIEGIKTSIPFHRRVLRNSVFLAGRYDTGFIDAHMRGGGE